MATASQLQQHARSAAKAPAPAAAGAARLAAAGSSTAAAGATASSDPPPQPACVGHRSYVISGMSFEVDSRYKCKSIVGKGAYGLVVAAEDTAARDGESSAAGGGPPPPAAPAPAGGAPAAAAAKQMVAVKKVMDPFHDHTDCKRLLREIRLLRSLRHPNVLHLTDIMPPASLTPDEASWKDVYLVTRLFDTNLHRVIYSGHALTDAHVQYILWQVSCAAPSCTAWPLTALHASPCRPRPVSPLPAAAAATCPFPLPPAAAARCAFPTALCAMRRRYSVPCATSTAPVWYTAT